MDGILIIDKEKGFTSSDVVAKLRGMLHQRRIGHAGTLDPDATGVLVVLLGRATKLSDMLMGGRKTYRTVLRLGVVTDTQDMSGSVLSAQEPEKDEGLIRDTVMSFVGEYDQLPPMYSAVKVNGKKLYQYARSGKEIEREPRRVSIDGITIEAVEPPLVRLSVQCSKGTYIRTLCHDIGQKLGCGAAMEELRRTASGCFSEADGLGFSEISRLHDEGRLAERLISLDRIFAEYPVFICGEEHEKALLNGNRLEYSYGEGSLKDGDIAAVRDHNGTLRALYRYDEKEGLLFPQLMLV